MEEKIHGAWNIDLEWKGADYKSTGITDAAEEIKKNNEGPYYVAPAAPAAPGIAKNANVIGGATEAKIGGNMMMGDMMGM